ncbi:transcriptional regulator with XRE-family HTH domain [Leucobacter komagatae]|uniref:Transcriptional regulator with XRE-family HTH domain n=1 Tax=Leucobacter komagatae TaxID=55969 RepID=A0A542Y3V6_9MICO|nr:helix-turn-helix transcriptional regulator [Leucobacter komagatae]TQL42753.1 transcriptional regulator with XRE-family HTH domain [Leucobacter komagatae]
MTRKPPGRGPAVMGRHSRNVAAGVRALRQSNGLTLGDLAKRTGEHGRTITTTQLSRLENGARTISVDDLFVLAEALEVETCVLTHFDEFELRTELVHATDAASRAAEQTKETSS